MSKRLVVFLTLLSVVVIAGSYVTLPYYSEAPGPAREVAPLITFTGHQRYDSQGHFVLTSVLESVQRWQEVVWPRFADTWNRSPGEHWTSCR